MANQGGQKISDFDTVDIIVKRLLDISLDKIAKFHGVSKQTILYHESKERTRELRTILLNRAAEVAGDVIGDSIGKWRWRNSGKRKIKRVNSERSTEINRTDSEGSSD